MLKDLVAKYNKELEYAGPFCISFDGFGTAPCGQIDYSALALEFALWLEECSILPEITGWSSLSGFCRADAEAYKAAFGTVEPLIERLRELEELIWDEFCSSGIIDKHVYYSEMPEEG